MPFDHDAASAQIEANIGYAGLEVRIEGDTGTYRAILTQEQSGGELTDFGFSESRDARALVKKSDFPTPPKHGAILTIVEDGRRYRIGPAARLKGSWEIELKAVEASTPPAGGQPFPL